jgi:hypothetical protein
MRAIINFLNYQKAKATFASLITPLEFIMIPPREVAGASGPGARICRE